MRMTAPDNRAPVPMNGNAQSILETWKVVPHPRLKRDFDGRTVRTLREMRNGMVVIPAGTIARVHNRSRTGITLTGRPCACCGLAVSISRVGDRDIEFLEAMPNNEQS